MDNELFDSAVRSMGDLAGVFEYDGVAGYFYLYDVVEKEQQKLIDSIRVLSGKSDLVDEDVAVRWDSAEQRVGLFLRGVPWAVFNAKNRTKHGGNFDTATRPDIPPEEIFSLPDTGFRCDDPS